MARFETQARILDLLGEEQIANCPTALSELFKNAHDAFATRARLDVYPGNDQAFLWDDGVGMSEEILTTRWLVVGTAAKRTTDRGAPPPPGFASRPIQGEKGIGRLAISTVGDSLLLISKSRTDAKAAPKTSTPKKRRSPYCALFVNWKVAHNLALRLSDIEIPIVEFDHIHELEESDILTDMIAAFKASLQPNNEARWSDSNAQLLRELLHELDSFTFNAKALAMSGIADRESGTVFCIQHLKPEIGQFVAPRAREDEEYPLNLELIQLLSNFRNEFDGSAAKYSFDVNVRRWNEATQSLESIFDDWEAFQPDDVRMYDHRFDVTFDEWGRVSGTVEVFRKPVALTPVEAQPRRALASGPFSVSLWYYQDRAQTLLTDDQFTIIERKLHRFGGLMVYRDGLRVLPYGRPDFDWLTFEERRSKKAGRYIFSYRRMFGYVAISDRCNPGLRDKSGREGLIWNTEFRQLRSRLTDFFVDAAARFFQNNPAFREEANELKKSARTPVDEQRLRAQQRRDKFKARMREALDYITESSHRAEDLVDRSIAQLQALSEPTGQDLGATLLNFRDRIARLEGPARVPIPQSLSFGRDRAAKELLAEYRLRHDLFAALCMRAHSRFTEKIQSLFPDAERAASQQKLLRDTRLQAHSKIGKAAAALRAGIDAQVARVHHEVEQLREAHLRAVDRALVDASEAASGVDGAIASNRTDVSRATVTMLSVAEDAVSAIETQAQQLEEHMGRILNGDMDKALYAQSDAIEVLQEEVSRNLELVQLGLSVEIIDHELNKLYRGTKIALRRLAALAQRSPSAASAVEQVTANFQHIEQRYKLMSPLYRGSYRTKSTISGSQIIDYVRSFLGDSLAAHEIQLTASSAFHSFTIVEAAAVILPVFVNLVDNSIYWLQQREQRCIDFGTHSRGVVVRDSGPGISIDALESAFDPFFSTKPNGRGLGLYVARANLRRHGHDIRATHESQYRAPFEGACFVLDFAHNAIGRTRGNHDD